MYILKEGHLFRLVVPRKVYTCSHTPHTHTNTLYTHTYTYRHTYADTHIRTNIYIHRVLTRNFGKMTF